MSIAETAKPESLAEVLARLGDIPPDRIRWRPFPGTASVADVERIRNQEGRLFELVEGVLVEKPMGFKESLLALVIASYLRDFVRPRKLGVVVGSDGMMQIFPNLVRIPDVAYASWSRMPEGKIPSEPAPPIAPDLAVEVLSSSNTKHEMQRKLREYLDAGVRLVWFFDLEKREVTVYTPDGAISVIPGTGQLDGGNVLPGFRLSVAQVFSELDEQPTAD